MLRPEEEKPIDGDVAPPKKPLTKAEIQSADATVSNLFRDDIAKARTQEQKVALVENLLTTAKAELERANRYALLNKAAELAASFGKSKLLSDSLDSADEIQFSPGVWVDNLGVLASKKPEDIEAVFDKIDTLVQKCYDADDYDSANKLAGTLLSFAGIAKRPGPTQSSKGEGSGVCGCKQRLQETRRLRLGWCWRRAPMTPTPT